MNIETIASKLAGIIAKNANAEAASKPVVALVLLALQSSKAPVETLAKLYTLTFNAAAVTKRKAVQSHFTRCKPFFAALVDYWDHPEMMDTFRAELALITVDKDGTISQATGAKRWPQQPEFVNRAKTIRAEEAEGPGKFKHENLPALNGCTKVSEALKLIEEELNRLAATKASLEKYSKKIVEDVIGKPSDFEIGGNATTPPTFALKKV